MKITALKYVCILILLTALFLIVYFFQVFTEKESKSKSNKTVQVIDLLEAEISLDYEIESQSNSIIKLK